MTGALAVSYCLPFHYHHCSSSSRRPAGLILVEIWIWNTFETNEELDGNFRVQCLELCIEFPRTEWSNHLVAWFPSSGRSEHWPSVVQSNCFLTNTCQPCIRLAEVSWGSLTRLLIRMASAQTTWWASYTTKQRSNTLTYWEEKNIL